MPADAPRKSIQQRARELEQQLGFTGNRGVSPPPPVGQIPNPNTLVTPPAWLELWAVCEHLVGTVTVEGVLEWLPQLMLQPCPIQGPIVTGAPGCVIGPGPGLHARLIRSPQLPQRQEARTFCERAVQRLDKLLELWRAQLAPMGLSWYPPYAAAPGPMAPSIPNVTCRLEDIARVAGPMLSATLVAQDLKNALDPAWSGLYGTEDIGKKVCDGIGAYVEGFFKMISASSMVQNVMGSGQVTGFAPPHVTVGMVMGHTQTAAGFITVVNTRPDLYG